MAKKRGRAVASPNQPTFIVGSPGGYGTDSGFDAMDTLSSGPSTTNYNFGTTPTDTGGGGGGGGGGGKKNRWDKLLKGAPKDNIGGPNRGKSDPKKPNRGGPRGGGGGGNKAKGKPKTNPKPNPRGRLY